MENQDRKDRLEFLELVLGEPFWYTKVELIYEYHELKKKVTQGWTIEKTAHALGRSIPSLNNDLALARSLLKWPDLKACVSRKNAEESARGRAK